MPNKYDINGTPDGIFTLTFKTMDHYQHNDPGLTEKLSALNIKQYICGIQKTNQQMIYEDKTVIIEILQIYTVNWNQKYIICPVIYIMDAIIFQYSYWHSIREAPQKEVTNYDK